MTTLDNWMKEALCTGHTHLFFPPARAEQSRTRYRREREAKKMCLECPVMLQCRDYARRNDEVGIWGGETEEDRWQAGFMRGNAVFKRKKVVAESRRRQKERRLLREQESASQQPS